MYANSATPAKSSSRFGDSTDVVLPPSLQAIVATGVQTTLQLSVGFRGRFEPISTEIRIMDLAEWDRYKERGDDKEWSAKSLADDYVIAIKAVGRDVESHGGDEPVRERTAAIRAFRARLLDFVEAETIDSATVQMDGEGGCVISLDIPDEYGRGRTEAARLRLDADPYC